MQQNLVASLYPDSFGNFLLAKGMNLSIAATGDVGSGLGVPFGQYRVRKVVVVNPPAAAGGVADVSACNLGIWDAASQGGNNLVANAALTGVNAVNKFIEMTMSATSNATVITSSTLFVNVGTSVTGGKVDVYIYGDVIGARA